MKITLIGDGKLGKHLYKVLISIDQVQLLEWVVRSEKKGKTPEGTLITNKINQYEISDLYLLAVSDNSIKEVAELLPNDSFVVHTSGAISLEEIGQNRAGVFYPIQTFSEESNINFSKIPIGIESKQIQDLKHLKKLTKLIGTKFFLINSSQREHLHLAAVLVNNFTNHLFVEADIICRQNKLSFDLLKPLLKETIEKLNKLSPKESQTGPAIRNDSETISKHLKLIAKNRLKEIYKVLTSAIQENND
tara:strand:- start:2786 stop:3529 length:744 start_codon:yes stop_codon:yes gene_type:complete